MGGFTSFRLPVIIKDSHALLAVFSCYNITMSIISLANRYRYVSSAIALGLLLLAFLSFTNPNNVSVGLLIVPVVLLFLIAFSVSVVVMNVLRILTSQARKQRVVAIISASFITVLTILASTGGISVTDIIIMVLILSIVTVYIDKF
jgi:hypothetical protein